MALAGDADITSDFLVPPDVKDIDGNFFTFTGNRDLDDSPTNFTVTKASAVEFPALNGQSVSYAVLQFAAGSINPPRTHPRSAELLFLTAVDAKNPAAAVSAFGSANAGTASLPKTLFATNIEDGILAQSFKTDVATVQALKSGLASK
ncbi:Cupin 1 - like 10 [Theobroma cacao]|nr:Cupin 1 - like 10 [Theobroma cacao]